jgi:hypothetical protein
MPWFYSCDNVKIIVVSADGGIAASFGARSSHSEELMECKQGRPRRTESCSRETAGVTILLCRALEAFWFQLGPTADQTHRWCFSSSLPDSASECVGGSNTV